MQIQLKRIYEDCTEEDGFRIFVERLWPRGISKEKAQLDLWVKEIAPSHDLRKWYNHDSNKWKEFRDRYSRELDEKLEDVQKIIDVVKAQKVTFLFASKEEKQNSANVLKEFIEKKLIK